MDDLRRKEETMTHKTGALLAAGALALVMSLGACGGQAKQDANAPTEEAPKATPAPEKVDYAPLGEEDEGSQTKKTESEVTPSSSASSEAASSETLTSVPVLDGSWRMVGRGEGEGDGGGMVATIDGDTIAVWVHVGGKDRIYWVGSFQAPVNDKSYNWISEVDKDRTKGSYASKADSLGFSYDEGIISFEYTTDDQTVLVKMEQESQETGLLEELLSSEPGTIPDDAEILDLTLDQCGYTRYEGKMYYALTITNPNADYAPKAVHVQVEVRRQDGSVRFSEFFKTSTILPGSTSYWANQVGDGSIEDTDTLDVSMSVNEGDWYQTEQVADFYALDNLNTYYDDAGHIVTTGQITLLDDVELDGDGNPKTPVLVAAMRDDTGNIIGGYSSYVTSELEVGVPVSFEVSSRFVDVECTSLELNANPW